VLIALQWLYLSGLVLVWFLLWFTTDRWWFSTMMSFGPRWIYPLPLAVLVPGCLFFDRRRWPVLLVSNVILWFPVMDFRCPWGRIFLPSGTTYRVLTCNLHTGEGDPAALRALIRRENPDFIALQEVSIDSIRSALEGYQVVQSGLLLVASRFPLHEEGNTSGLEPLHVNPRIHVLLCSADTPQGKLLFGSVHLPSPRFGLSNVMDRKTGIQPSKKILLEEHIRLRREESAAIAVLVKRFSGPVILAGDFNTPVESAIYSANWSSYWNAFSRTGFGFGRTFQADVHGIPFGVRIDHILGSPQIVPARCWVGPAIGSEHLPVLAEMIRE
jgi:endonuclease/exonuclease/phosphatase (EEP) superfamily protein YafD